MQYKFTDIYSLPYGLSLFSDYFRKILKSKPFALTVFQPSLLQKIKKLWKKVLTTPGSLVNIVK
ncbi:MAG: hypothetical protein VKJ86_04930, partial [Synechococcus sp.]|nr:hypothetical protein [Synechococcus sp.]